MNLENIILDSNFSISGEELANLEMFLILTNLLKDFAFRVPPGKKITTISLRTKLITKIGSKKTLALPILLQPNRIFGL